MMCSAFAPRGAALLELAFIGAGATAQELTQFQLFASPSASTVQTLLLSLLLRFGDRDQARAGPLRAIP